MKNNRNYRHTLYACYMGYVTQAIVNNFVPLLFLTFQKSFNIPLEKITFLVTLNFGLQLLVDLMAVKFVDRAGYRASAIAAHIFAAIGIGGLAIFPKIFPTPYAGLLTAVVFYAAGGGLIEVLISPIVEACPTQKKEASMSLLHSFYCWGQVFVILCSTIFFLFAGIDKWPVLTIIWLIIPIMNAVWFTRVPIKRPVEEAKGMNMKQLFSLKSFWVLLLLMLCAGASEQSMGQWASAFAEDGMLVSKTAGDLAGPCTFAAFMGVSRVFYAKYSEKINLQKFMMVSGVLCAFSYCLASLSQTPVLGLAGCGLCGLSVGILWPGTFSVAAKSIRYGGTAMYALLALAGDLGCSMGPTFVGAISDAAGNNLKKGLLIAVIFPAMLTVCLFFVRKSAYKEKEKDVKSLKKT